MQKSKLPLSALKKEETGVVVFVQGGESMRRRLEALGIRLGAKIKKKSKLFGLGPVIVSVGNAEIAVGYGMVTRIFVEVDRK
ncbi:MAG TPA: FeoA family protein [Oscillospiraceae bacterium]|nr:FeoA family protein [Oscillospiraceae bacterium]